MSKKSLNIVTGVLAALMLTQTQAFADEFRRGYDDHRHGVMLRPHEMEVWRGGRWFHGHHGGQRGWWWIAGGVWYFYPSPVYPYPDPYMPPGVVVQPAPVVVQPPVVVQQPAPVMVERAPATTPPPPAPAAQQYWYYCTSPAGYYPNVPSCAGGWQKVPAR